MDKHRTNVFIALVLVLLIVAAILAWATGSEILSGAPVTSNDGDKPASTKAVPTPVAEETEPASTPEQSKAPKATPTPKPTATPKPSARTLDESGSIKSDTGANINMRVDWHITSKSSTELTLDVEIYVSSYAINAGQHNGVIRLCGKEYAFISEPIRNDDNSSLHDTLIYGQSVTIPAEIGETVAVPISCKWEFGGVYGGKTVNNITAEATLTIKA